MHVKNELVDSQGGTAGKTNSSNLPNEVNLHFFKVVIIKPVSTCQLDGFQTLHSILIIFLKLQQSL